MNTTPRIVAAAAAIATAPDESFLYHGHTVVLSCVNICSLHCKGRQFQRPLERQRPRRGVAIMGSAGTGFEPATSGLCVLSSAEITLAWASVRDVGALASRNVVHSDSRRQS